MSRAPLHVAIDSLAWCEAAAFAAYLRWAEVCARQALAAYEQHTLKAKGA